MDWTDDAGSPFVRHFSILHISLIRSVTAFASCGPRYFINSDGMLSIPGDLLLFSDLIAFLTSSSVGWSLFSSRSSAVSSSTLWSLLVGFWLLLRCRSSSKYCFHLPCISVSFPMIWSVSSRQRLKFIEEH